MRRIFRLAALLGCERAKVSVGMEGDSEQLLGCLEIEEVPEYLAWAYSSLLLVYDRPPDCVGLHSSQARTIMVLESRLSGEVTKQ